MSAQSSLPPGVIQNQSVSIPSGAANFLAQFLQPVQPGDMIVFGLAWQGAVTISSITDTQGDSFAQLTSTSYGSGASQVNVAIWRCLSAKGGTPVMTVTFSSAPTSPACAILDINGSTNPLSIDPTGTAVATYTGGSATTTPSVSITLSYYFEAEVAIVSAPTAASMTVSGGWTAALNTGTVGVFLKNFSDVTGARTPQPCTLNAAVSSAIASTSIASLNQAILGHLFSPLFPDTFAPRLADQLYDSLQGDPTFVADPYGPRPQLFA